MKNLKLYNIFWALLQSATQKSLRFNVIVCLRWSNMVWLKVITLSELYNDNKVSLVNCLLMSCSRIEISKWYSHLMGSLWCSSNWSQSIFNDQIKRLPPYSTIFDLRGLRWPCYKLPWFRRRLLSLNEKRINEGLKTLASLLGQLDGHVLDHFAEAEVGRGNGKLLLGSEEREEDVGLLQRRFL